MLHLAHLSGSAVSPALNTSSKLPLKLSSDAAGVIVEPVVGQMVLVLPKEYMPRLRQICDVYGALLIADEVMTGWCRTGKWYPQ